MSLVTKASLLSFGLSEKLIFQKNNIELIELKGEVIDYNGSVEFRKRSGNGRIVRFSIAVWLSSVYVLIVVDTRITFAMVR